MDDNELIKKLNASDIPKTYTPVVDLIGIDSFLKLCKYASGDELYFPMPASILKNIRKRLIIQEYDGYNIQELSRKYGLTQRRIHEIIKGSKRP